MGAIIGFSSPSVRPWWDLRQLLPPCLAQEGEPPGPLGVSSQVGKVTRCPDAWHTHPTCAPGSGGTTAAVGPGVLTAHWAGLGCVPGPVLGAGAGGCMCGGDPGDCFPAPLQMLPHVCLFPTLLSQVRGQGGPSLRPQALS